MLKEFLALFRPPSVEGDESAQYSANAANLALWGLILLSAFSIASAIISAGEANSLNFAINVGSGVIQIGVYGVLLYLLHRGQISLAVNGAIFIVLLGSVWQSANSPLSYSGLINNLLVIVLAAFLLSRYIFVTSIAASLIAGIIFFYQTIVSAPAANATVTIAGMVSFLITSLGSGALLQFLAHSLRARLNHAQTRETELQHRNEELQTMGDNLQKIINQRVTDLELEQKKTRRRASQIEAVSQVARAATTMQDFDNLLPFITRVIAQEFGYYHVGIFLMDQRREYVELRAANSPGGQVMLEQKHRLKVGVQGIVGSVAYLSRARIALDVGADAAYFNNPHLPQTHSEIALPLSLGEQLIGVLDVQSSETNAFSADDQEILQTLANQIAIIIENSRLFTQMREASHQAEINTREYIAQEWALFSKQMDSLGYRFTGLATETLTDKAHNPTFHLAEESGEIQKSADAVGIPIKLRGETIGIIGLKAKQASTSWSSADLTIASAAAERVALALENARLIEETRKRAVTERLSADIAGKLSASVRFETIMRTAAEEISQALQGADVLVQLQKNTERPSDS